MDVAAPESTNAEIERLIETKSELYRLGWHSKRKFYVAILLVFLYIGSFAAGDLLLHGVSVVNLLAIIATGLAFKKATAMERMTFHYQAEYWEVSKKLDALGHAGKNSSQQDIKNST